MATIETERRKRARTALVIPTNRPFSKEWVDSWDVFQQWDEVHIVEDRAKAELCDSDVWEQDDACDPPRKSNLIFHDWGSIQRELGNDNWIISKRDGGIRSFGLYCAWRNGCDVIMMMDDDCFPENPMCDEWIDTDLIMKHREILFDNGLPKFVNVGDSVRLRGLPYENVGKLFPKINLGLWDGVPDVDAITQLSHKGSYVMRDGKSQVVGMGQYIPVSAMNLACHRDAAVLLYQPVMGEGQPYRRFDDIWGGIVAKKLCDKLGWSMSWGPPYVYHSRASNPFVNLVKEAPGIPVNEHFWETIDGIQLYATTAVALVLELAEAMGELEPPKMMCESYWHRLCAAYKIWGRLFQ